jgi:hypothetical protein
VVQTEKKSKKKTSTVSMAAVSGTITVLEPQTERGKIEPVTEEDEEDMEEQ